MVEKDIKQALESVTESLNTDLNCEKDRFWKDLTKNLLETISFLVSVQFNNPSDWKRADFDEHLDKKYQDEIKVVRTAIYEEIEKEYHEINWDYITIAFDYLLHFIDPIEEYSCVFTPWGVIRFACRMLSVTRVRHMADVNEMYSMHDIYNLCWIYRRPEYGGTYVLPYNSKDADPSISTFEAFCKSINDNIWRVKWDINPNKKNSNKKVNGNIKW